MAVTNKRIVMDRSSGKFYDPETNEYKGRPLRGGRPLFSTLDRKRGGMYVQPSIYGFESAKGDTSYYTGTVKGDRRSGLNAKATDKFLGNIAYGFDTEYMDRTGLKKIDLPKGMNIDKYYERFFKKGKTPRKAGDKLNIGSKIFNFLKKEK